MLIMLREITIIGCIIGALTMLILGYWMIVPWQIVGVLVAFIAMIIGVIQIYFPKEKEKNKTIRQTDSITQKNQVISETIHVGRYEQSYDFELKKDEHLKGIISSNNPIDIYIINEINYKKWLKDENFNYEFLTESIYKTNIDFKVPRRGTWYLILKMSGSKSAKVEVNVQKTSNAPFFS